MYRIISGNLDNNQLVNDSVFFMSEFVLIGDKMILQNKMRENKSCKGRHFGIFAAALILVSLLGGCNSTGKGASSAESDYKASSLTASQKSLTLSTTTSVRDSGLMDYLLPQFEKDSGITVKMVAQGTGAAIQTATDGNADVVLVHDRAAEDKFISSGNGLKRIEVMYNYFVIVGPKNDPAGIMAAKMTDAAAAFSKIANAKDTFVSRGDKSGTNSKELSLWTSAKITPSGTWYVSAGKGMGDVLTMTSEMQGYTLTDKATYLSMKSKLNLQIVLENAANLKNQYTIIAVNPANHNAINAVGAQEFIKWMTSSKGLKMISEYGKSKYGTALFTVDYNPASYKSSASSSSASSGK